MCNYSGRVREVENIKTIFACFLRTLSASIDEVNKILKEIIDKIE